MMVDEADVEVVNSSGGGTRKRAADSPASSPRAKGRKPGPIPRDVLVRRPSTPTPTPPPSPTLTPSLPSEFIPTAAAAVSPVPAANPTPAAIPVSPVAEPEIVELDPPKPLVNGNTGAIKIISRALEFIFMSVIFPEHIEQQPRSPSPPPEIVATIIPEAAIPVPAVTPVLPPTPPATNHVILSPVPNHVNNSPPLPPPPPRLEQKVVVPTAAEILAIKRHNIQLRSMAFKEVRRPGKGTILFCLLHHKNNNLLNKN